MAEDPKEFLRRLSAKRVADMQAAEEQRRLEKKRKQAARYAARHQPPPAEDETEAALWVRRKLTWEEHPELWVPKFCSWSNYVGGSLEKSNGKALIRDFPDLFKEGIGGYGTIWVGMPEDKRLTLADDAWENLRYVIEGMEDYPVIDEVLMSQIENEAKWEDWQHYGRNAIREELIKKFGHDADAQIAVVAKRNKFWDELFRTEGWDELMEEEPGGTWAFHEKQAVCGMDRDELVVPAEVEAVKKAVFGTYEDKLARALQNAGVDVMNGQYLWEMFQYAEHVLTPLSVWKVSANFFKEDAEVDPVDQVEIVDLDNVVRVLTEPEAQQKAMRKHWANDPRQLKLPGYESLAQALVASLLEDVPRRRDLF